MHQLGLRFLVVAALLTVLVGVAEAQLGDVGEQTQVDTDYTPRAKASERWQWFAGARFASGGPRPADVPDVSQTPFEADLFDVEFREKAELGETDVGLAGGALCEQKVPLEASAEEARAGLAACERAPVVYRYTVNDVGEGAWEEVYRGQGRGFVGAVAWIDRERALAVGGTGRYPRRELRRGDGESDAAYMARNDAGEEENAAGMARAWLYEGGAWRELSAAELPAGMRGMSALDFSPRKTDCGEETKSECAFAGGLRQIWRYRDGSFDKGYIGGRPGDNPAPSPTTDLDRPELLRFRVREIEFVTVEEGSGANYTPPVAALGVTAGCCDPDPLKNAPWVLGYGGGRWSLHQSQGEAASVFYNESKRDLQSGRPGESVYPIGRSGYEFVRQYPQGLLNLIFGLTGQPPPNPLAPHCDSLAPVLAPADERQLCPLATESPAGAPTEPVDDAAEQRSRELTEAYRAPNRAADAAAGPYASRGQVPDSYYGLVAGRSAPWWPQGVGARIAATPGGPVPDPNAPGAAAEPAAQIISGTVAAERGSFGLGLTSGQARLVTTLRIHSLGGGRVSGSPGLEAVGVLGSTGQGAAFGPAEATPDRSHQALHGCNVAVDDARCDPSADRFVGNQGSLQLFKLPAYALNSVELTDEFRNEGWAVGDYGAVLKLGAETAAAAAAREPGPPELGPREPAARPDSSAYDPFRPVSTNEPGVVPGLGGRLRERLGEPRFVPGGSPEAARGQPEEVAQIVMSRDGSEGWAVGPASGTGALALHHYDGTRWRRCDTEGVPGLLPPDPACSAIGPVRAAGVRLYAATRVPLENDPYPENDDEFEVVAVGTAYRTAPAEPLRPVVLRYRKGRWGVDEETMRAVAAEGDFRTDRLHDIEFTSPTDGWALAGGEGPDLLLHFDGTTWRGCTSAAAKSFCQDPEGRLSFRFGFNVESDPGALRLASAGSRTYLYGTRIVAPSVVGLGPERQAYPMIVYHDRGKSCEKAGDGGCWRGSVDGSDGGYDPGFTANPSPDHQGKVGSLSVGVGGDGGGELEGWAQGIFGGVNWYTAETPLLRLVGGRWTRWLTHDASEDYLRGLDARLIAGDRLLAIPDASGRWSAFAFNDRRSVPLGFSRDRGRWEAVPAPFRTKGHPVIASFPSGDGDVRAVAPNGRGGFWAAVRQGSVCSPCQDDLHFLDFTDSPPKPVFTDVPHPMTDRRITAVSGGGDGSLWVATASSVLYRYDRLTGWDRISVAGWDPPRSTVPIAAHAVAVGPDGRGIAVGDGGRIAAIGPEGARLDSAAGTLCALDAPVPPCGTGRSLTEVAVAADGAALAAGSVGTLLWRPPGGEFRRIPSPRIPPATPITGVALPHGDEAYLTTPNGQVLAGRRASDGAWHWRVDSVDARGPLTLDPAGQPLGLNAIAVDGLGHGFAVGDRGLLLERSAAGWRRVPSGYLDDFQSVALPPGGGNGALIGGTNGLVLTFTGGRFEVAHQTDAFDPVNGTIGGIARVPGVALVPGAASDSLEAWAALQAPASDQRSLAGPVQSLLHYSSDPDPLLNAQARAHALPDAPPPRPGELSFAALGKQECRYLVRTQSCPESAGTNAAPDVLARRIQEELAGAGTEAGARPGFVIFTGDANDAAGGAATPVSGLRTAEAPTDRDLKHRRWLELFADPLAEELPLFGAIGGQDLSHVASCDVRNCVGTRGAGSYELGVQAGAGVNVQWRETMGRWPAPWEADGGRRETERLTFERVPDTSLSTRAPEVSTPEVAVEDLDGAERAKVKPQPVAGGASTHYAVDVSDSASGEKVARLVFVDTSLGSLAAGDPVQQPVESDGGQAAWLEKMLCFRGSANATHECDREPGQQAIVVSNTPTYTYAQIPPTDTQTDASAFEAILLRNRANVVVSGRLGWNGRYWATAPGVHEPCPGDPYQAEPPQPGARVCGRGTGEAGVETPAPEQAAAELAQELGGLGVSVPAEVERATGVGGTGVLPFVVAGSAGGHFNRVATDDAADGYWRGYSIVRLDASGDPAKTIVEQRPVLDWIAIRAQERTLRPGQKMTLRGFGREPIGIDQPIRYIEIDSPAITHRYDLVLADPEKPYLPFEDAAGDYVPLPAQVATVDRQTGALKTGKGRGERTYAIAILSVGEEAATYPLVFEPRRSFAAQRAKVTLPALPRAARAPVAQQPLRLSDTPPPPAPPPAATPATPISSTTLQTPQAPEFPSLPTATPAGPPPAPSLSAPPPPPTPPPAPPVPPQQQPQPLALGAKVQAVAIVPSVNPPAPPPVNPAPPGGAAARKEAKQRQAATAKSEEGSQDSGAEAEVSHSSDPSHSSTRLDDGRHAFTRLEQRSASPLSQTALYGGGTALMALALALGWSVGRPGPRRRPPEVPAPAHAILRDRRR